MRTLASPSFFRSFDLLTGIHNSGFKRARWTMNGVACERERHSFSGAMHGFAVEIVTLVHPGKRGWTLMIVKEYWWLGSEGKDMRTTRWARPLQGRKADIVAWFREQSAALDRSAADSERELSSS
jgi:hypothetical protein